MKPFQTFSSQVIPIPLQNIDTDMIIPAEFLTSISQRGYGKNLFKRLIEKNKNFPTNQNKYKNAQILIAKNNFGCGSSREHAVWALTNYGIKAIISPSFADIFTNNSAKNGLLLIKLTEEKVNKILKATKVQNKYEITINLKEQKITLPENEELSFKYDPFRKECLIKGNSDLDYLIDNISDIQKWFKEKER